MPGTTAEVRQEVGRLLSEATEQQKKAKYLIDMVLEDFKNNPNQSREQTVDGVSLRELRVLTDSIQDKCWANIAKCYKLLETNSLDAVADEVLQGDNHATRTDQAHRR